MPDFHHPHASLAQLVQNYIVAQHQTLALALMNLLNLKHREFIPPPQFAGNLLGVVLTLSGKFFQKPAAPRPR